jgi:hypothetical protein
MFQSIFGFSNVTRVKEKQNNENTQANTNNTDENTLISWNAPSAVRRHRESLPTICHGNTQIKKTQQKMNRRDSSMKKRNNNKVYTYFISNSTVIRDGKWF